MQKIYITIISLFSLAVVNAGDFRTSSDCHTAAKADSLISATMPQSIDSLLIAAENRFFERTSPERDDALYAAIVDRAEALGAVGPDSRADILRTDARRILPGMQAPDFPITLADDSRHSLYSFIGEGRPTLLIFYDPECEDCHDLINELMSIPAVADGSVAGVAVYLDDDTDAWHADLPRMPRGWAVGSDADSYIESDEKWVIGGIPSVYLIGADDRIIIKDDTGDRVLRMLSDENKIAEMFAPAD